MFSIAALVVVGAVFTPNDHTHAREVQDYLDRVEWLRTCSTESGVPRPFPAVHQHLAVDPVYAGEEGITLRTYVNWLDATSWVTPSTELQQRRISVLAEALCRIDKIWEHSDGVWEGIDSNQQNYVDTCNATGNGLSVGTYTLLHTTQTDSSRQAYTPGRRYRISVEMPACEQDIIIQVRDVTAGQLLPMETKWKAPVGSPYVVSASSSDEVYFRAPAEEAHDLQLELVGTCTPTLTTLLVEEATPQDFHERHMLVGMAKLWRLYQDGKLTAADFDQASTYPGLYSDCTFNQYPTLAAGETHAGWKTLVALRQRLQSRLDYWGQFFYETDAGYVMHFPDDGGSIYPGASMAYNIGIPIAQAFYLVGDLRGLSYMHVYASQYDGNVNYWDVLEPTQEADGGSCGLDAGRPTKRVASPSRLYEQFGYMANSMAPLQESGEFPSFMGQLSTLVTPYVVTASDGAPWVAELFQDNINPSTGGERRNGSWIGWSWHPDFTQLARQRIDQNYGWPCTAGAGFADCIAAYETSCADDACLQSSNVCPDFTKRPASTAGATGAGKERWRNIALAEATLANIGGISCGAQCAGAVYYQNTPICWCDAQCATRGDCCEGLNPSCP